MLRIIPSLALHSLVVGTPVALVSRSIIRRFHESLYLLYKGTGYSSVRAQSSVSNQRYSALTSTDSTDNYQVNGTREVGYKRLFVCSSNKHLTLLCSENFDFRKPKLPILGGESKCPHDKCAQCG